MSLGMATLYGVGLIVGGFFVLCALMWFCYSAKDWLRRLRRKPVVHGDGPAPGCKCEDCADMRKRMRTRPDCAEACCWPLRMDELVAGFDWNAAEDDLLRRRP